MQNNSGEHAEHRIRKELWSEMLEIVNKQLEVNNQLIKIITSLAKAPSRSETAEMTKETTDTLTELIVETEALQARLRAAFHNLYPEEELYETSREIADEYE